MLKYKGCINLIIEKNPNWGDLQLQSRLSKSSEKGKSEVN